EMPLGRVVAEQLDVDGVYQVADLLGQEWGGLVDGGHVVRAETDELGQVAEAVAQVGLELPFVDALQRQGGGGSHGESSSGVRLRRCGASTATPLAPAFGQGYNKR